MLAETDYREEKNDHGVSSSDKATSRAPIRAPTMPDMPVVVHSGTE